MNDEEKKIWEEVMERRAKKLSLTSTIFNNITGITFPFQSPKDFNRFLRGYERYLCDWVKIRRAYAKQELVNDKS